MPTGNQCILLGMGPSDAEIDAIEYRLKKRGFMRYPRPIDCDKCDQRGMFTYATRQSRIGGRTIDWCHLCGRERGWTRPAGQEDRVEEAGFDLLRFLE